MLRNSRIRLCVLCVLCGLSLSVFSVAGAGKSDVADAAMRGDKAAVRKLIAAKADVHAAHADGATPLHWALYRAEREPATDLSRPGAKTTSAKPERATQEGN